MAQEINKINLEEESKEVAYACNFNFSKRKNEEKKKLWLERNIEVQILKIILI